MYEFALKSIKLLLSYKGANIQKRQIDRYYSNVLTTSRSKEKRTGRQQFKKG